METLYEDLE
jgi:nucleoside diphosphate kinase